MNATGSWLAEHRTIRLTDDGDNNCDTLFISSQNIFRHLFLKLCTIYFLHLSGRNTFVFNKRQVNDMSAVVRC